MQTSSNFLEHTRMTLSTNFSAEYLSITSWPTLLPHMLHLSGNYAIMLDYEDLPSAARDKGATPVSNRVLHCKDIELNARVGASGQADKIDTTLGSSFQEDVLTGAFAESKLGRREGKCLSKGCVKSNFVAWRFLVGDVAEICSRGKCPTSWAC